MREKNENWIIKALVSTATLTVGFILFFLIIWIAVVLGFPPSLSWMVAIIGPIIVGGFYVLVGFTTLGKYLWDLPPGSLG